VIYNAPITDKTVGIFVALFLFVITAFGFASQVAFYDRDDTLRSARSSWMQSFLGLNGMADVPKYSYLEQATEPKSYGYAGFFFCATTLVGNLILSNLIVNVLGERYTKACQDLEKSKRKLQIDNFVKHGRHVLLSKLYYNSVSHDNWFWFLNPLSLYFYLPWLGNKSVSVVALCLLVIFCCCRDLTLR
jgi:hypothetical protein